MSSWKKSRGDNGLARVHSATHHIRLTLILFKSRSLKRNWRCVRGKQDAVKSRWEKQRHGRRADLCVWCCFLKNENPIKAPMSLSPKLISYLVASPGWRCRHHFVVHRKTLGEGYTLTRVQRLICPSATSGWCTANKDVISTEITEPSRPERDSQTCDLRFVSRWRCATNGTFFSNLLDSFSTSSWFMRQIRKCFEPAREILTTEWGEPCVKHVPSRSSGLLDLNSC